MLPRAARFGGEGYKVSSGLHGVGASVVNALSRHMESSSPDRRVYQQEYNREVEYDLRVTGVAGHTGTAVRFWPDIKSPENPDGIFEQDAAFRFDVLQGRMREMSFLNKGVRIEITDERTEPAEYRNYHFEGGIVEFVKYINKNRTPLHPEPIYIEGMKNEVAVEIALQYNDSYQENTFAFANNVRTPEGGTHLVGFYSALTRAVNDYGRRYKILKEADANLKGEDVRESLAAVVSVKLREPQFEGQTKSKLGNSEVRGIVDSLCLSRSTRTWRNPSPPGDAGPLPGRRACRVPGKPEIAPARRCWNPHPCRQLADCSETNPALCEIFLVENAPPAVRQVRRNRDFRPFCRCGARSSTLRRRWTAC